MKRGRGKQYNTTNKVRQWVWTSVLGIWRRELVLWVVKAPERRLGLKSWRMSWISERGGARVDDSERESRYSWTVRRAPGWSWAVKYRLDPEGAQEALKVHRLGGGVMSLMQSTLWSAMCLRLPIWSRFQKTKLKATEGVCKLQGGPWPRVEALRLNSKGYER